jgi:hypothetical protein
MSTLKAMKKIMHNSLGVDLAVVIGITLVTSPLWDKLS